MFLEICSFEFSIRRKPPRTKYSAFFHGDERPYLSGPGKMLDKGIGWFAKIEIHNGKKGN